MLLGLEIGMLVAGVIALATGKFRLSKSAQVEGVAARIAGIVLLLPFPLAFTIFFFIGFNEAAHGRTFVPEHWRGVSIALEVLLALGCLVGAFVIGWIAKKRPDENPSGFTERFPSEGRTPPVPSSASAELSSGIQVGQSAKLHLPNPQHSEGIVRPRAPVEREPPVLLILCGAAGCLVVTFGLVSFVVIGAIAWNSAASRPPISTIQVAQGQGEEHTLVPPVFQFPPTPDPPRIVPPALKEDVSLVVLPSPVQNLVVGGAGRYLILHLPATKELGIFDVNQARIVKLLPVGEEDVKFAAGATKLVVLLPKQNLLQRYDLTTFNCETSVPCPIEQVNDVLLGSASNGPLLLGSTFFDLLTFQRSPIRQGGVTLAAGPRTRVAANGRTFTQVPVLAITGGNFFEIIHESNINPNILPRLRIGDLQEANSVVVPNSDGSTGFGWKGFYDLKGERSRGWEPEGPPYFPAAHGNSYFTLVLTNPKDPYRSPFKSVNFFVAGNKNPVGTLTRLGLNDEVQPLTYSTSGPLPLDRRFISIPAAKLFVVVPPKNDRLVLHRVAVYGELPQSGQR